MAAEGRGIMSGLSLQKPPEDELERFSIAAAELPVPERLNAIIAELARPCEKVEATFLDAGSRLAACAEQLQTITQLFETLPQQLEGNHVSAATMRLTEVADRLQVIASSTREQGNSLGRLLALANGVKRPIGDLSEAIGAVGVVAINARIAAAYLTNHAGDTAVFTTDIHRLSSNAAATVSRFAAIYHRAVDVLSAATKQWAEFEASHHDTLETLNLMLRESLTEIAKHRQQAAGGSAEAGRLSKQIAGRVGNAVMALQIGDITRQRVEHVEQALESLINGEVQAKSEAELNAMAGAVCRLQSAQLEQAITDFDREAVAVSSALRELTADAEHALSYSRNVYGRDDSSQSFLAKLGAELRKSHQLIRHYEQARIEVDKSTDVVTSSIKEMLSYVDGVRAIEFDLRIVSLNMSINCRRIGDHGRALNVIAQELRSLVASTVTAVHAVSSGLREAVTVAEPMNTSGARQQSEQLAELERQALDATALLETVDVTLGDALTSIARDGLRVTRLLGEASAALAGRDAIAEAFRDALAAIKEVTEELGGEGGLSDDVALQRQVVQLGSRYTMASEREMHLRVSAGQSVSPPRPEGEESKTSLDDVFL